MGVGCNLLLVVSIIWYEFGVLLTEHKIQLMENKQEELDKDLH
jgi:hypothetical protein